MPSLGRVAGTVTQHCFQCGQSLIVPTDDLGKSYRCPRCGTVHAAGTLVDKSTPVAAVPESDRAPGGVSIARVEPEGTVPLPQSMSPRPPLVSGMGIASVRIEDRPVEVTPWDLLPAATPLSGATAADAPTPPPSRKGATALTGPDAASREPLPSSPDARRADAAAHAAQAVAVASAATSHLLTFADQVDSKLYGKRGRLLVMFAGLVVLAPYVRRWLGRDFPAGDMLAPIALLLFSVLVALLVVARIAMFRDEDGRWGLELGIHAAKAWAIEVWESFQRFAEAKPNQKLETGGRLLFSAGLVSLAARATLDVADVDLNWPDSVDWAACVAGLALWFRGFWATRQEGKREALVIDPTREPKRAQAVATAFGALPLFVDCRDDHSIEALVAQTDHPLARRLIEVLGRWKSRRYYDEEGYQRSLARFLQKELPEAEAQREVPLRTLGLRHFGRVDFLVGHCILIEMKHQLTTSKAQKAIGQIGMYVQLQETKGPVVAMLLLCDSDPDRARSILEPHMRRLRNEGHAVVVALAGA